MDNDEQRDYAEEQYNRHLINGIEAEDYYAERDAVIESGGNWDDEDPTANY